MAAVLTFSLPGNALAGISTDSSLGHPAQALVGPNYLIPETQGRLSGNNLFHSFQTFNILTGESANFTTATPGIANVISRVTGGSASQINGQLSLTPCAGCGAPNFFFINPAGVVIGAGAWIDVPGAFHAGTADYIKFTDGNFHADLNQVSTFSSAPPEAFGFLGATRASVTINGGASLQTRPLQPISIVGGDIEINNATVATQGGDIRVVAVGQSAQEVGLTGSAPTVNGNLVIRNGGLIAADTSSSYDAGSVKVNAGTVTVDGQGSAAFTGISSDAMAGSGNAGNVEVTAAGNLSLINGGVISSGTWSAGSAGSVMISADSIAVDGQGGGSFTAITSNANSGSTGSAGSVTVTVAGNLSLVNGGLIASDTWSSGDAGYIRINAGNLYIDGLGSGLFTGISSDANVGSSGYAGIVDITAAGNLSIANGGVISSSTYSAGDAGYVLVNAASVAIDSGGYISSDAQAGSTGNANYVDVATTTGNISLSNGGFISSSTSGAGSAGYVNVSSASALLVDGVGSGINAVANTGSSGQTGDVSVAAGASITLSNGGQLSIQNDATVADPSLLWQATLMVTAPSITLDGGNITAATSGNVNAGWVDVAATGNLSILHGGAISSDTASSGDAGAVMVNAGSITIDDQNSCCFTGIASSAKAGSNGNAGAVDVTVTDSLSIMNSGYISSDTDGSGNAGYIMVSAGSLSIDSQGSGFFTGICSDANAGSTGNAGNVDVTTTGNMSIINGGAISSSAFSSGDAGYVRVSAGNIAIDGQGAGTETGVFSNANAGSSGNACIVDITAAGSLSILSGGIISSSTSGPGSAGYVTVSSGTTLLVDGVGSGINALANAGSSGQTGDVSVAAGDSITLSNGGQLSIQNDATVADPSLLWLTSLTVTAPSITLDGGSITAATSGNVNAGWVDVVATGNLSLGNGGIISSDTYSSGEAGYVKVSAGNVAVNQAYISSDTNGSGNAGGVEVSASGSLSVSNFGTITSDTYDLGNAGSVKVSAGNITIDSFGQISSDAFVFSAGNAGLVDVSTSGTLALTGGAVISSDAWEFGDAGAVTVSANSLMIDGNSYISSDTIGSGNAGSVDVVTSGRLSITNGGEISSKTYDAGMAGTVTVSAGTLSVDGALSSGEASGINASAKPGSSGQTGDIIVTAADGVTLSNGGQISIRNDANAADLSVLMPTSISVTAPRITILNSPNAITTSSTENVSAGSIKITAGDKLFLDPSGITTTSNLGNGGAIDITAGILMLDNSQIATSVNGLAGNGGNITINANTLILNTGFIQANTAAANASGGTVSIAARNLIPSGNTLFLGGNVPYTYQPGIFAFNVIQAAAPTGVSGTVQTSSPVLDVAGSLSGLSTQVIDAGGLGRSPCQATGGSSLAQTGRGGLPPSARGLLRSELSFSSTETSGAPPVRASDLHGASSNWGCS